MTVFSVRYPRIDSDGNTGLLIALTTYDDVERVSEAQWLVSSDLPVEEVRHHLGHHAEAPEALVVLARLREDVPA